MRTRLFSWLIAPLCLLLLQQLSHAQAAGAEPLCESRYTFSWPAGDCTATPRGATTQGPPVTLADTPSTAWQALQAPGLSAFERDRQAILAMAGGYRAQFEFLETTGYAPGYQRARPYQSWTTEYVYVVADQGDFISLQHIMVMYFLQGEQVSGPMVVKHWRQDWQYEPASLLAYQGQHQWRVEPLDAAQTRGQWTQSVYHVDDTPRYAGLGRWEHNASFSSWLSNRTWRPLPRREHTVRSDYQVLEGTNRHVILPSGWLHEQDNQKRVATHGSGEASYVAREVGVNRYDRVTGLDFSAGDRYWAETSPFWALVREFWVQAAQQHPRFEIRMTIDGDDVYGPLFDMAHAFRTGALNADSARARIAAHLGPRVQAP